MRGHTSIHSKSSSLCLLKKQAYSPGKIFPLSFLFCKASPLSLLPPCLKQPIKYAAFSINSRSLSCFHVFPSSPVWNPFSCSLCFSKKQSSFASCFVFFLSPLQLSFEKKSVQSLHALCFFILQPNASDKIHPYDAKHHKGIKAQYHQVISDGLCRVHNLSRVYQRRHQ